MTAHSNARTPMAATAKRQETASVRTPTMRRPDIPPMALPPMYRPIASPTAPASISSLRYAMATDGNPLNVIPSSARQARNIGQVGMNADSSVRAAEQNKESTMMGFRPQASDNPPARSKDTARQPVVREMARLLWAALT